jgi:hypothetical protein
MEDFNLREERKQQQAKMAEEAQELSDVQQYRYTPFRKGSAQNEVRLLTLFPCGEDKHALIECSIDIVVLDENTQYEALSYCWGDAKDKRLVSMQQPEGRFKLQVNRNLHTALRYLRLSDKLRVLWIDAVCINQDDLLERNQQVAMMRDIYRSSANTVIWLGEATPECCEALDLVSKIIEVGLADERLGIRRNLWSVNEAERMGLPMIHNTVWYDLFDFFNREWFYRVWIIQELALSKKATILCGKKSLPWKMLALACVYLIRNGLNGPTFDVGALMRCVGLDIQRDDLQKDRPRTVMSVLLDNIRARATDPRDHIFAFNGMFEPGSFDEIVTRPDYQRDCAGVYIKFAVDLLQQQQSLDMLSIPCSTEEPNFGKTPSWVPDWSKTGHIECFLARQYNLKVPNHLRPVYRASGDSSFKPRFDETGQKLLLTGYLVDTIDEVSTVLEPNSDSPLSKHEDRTKLYKSMIQHAKMMRSAYKVGLPWSFRKTYPTGEERVDAFWQTLAAGNVRGDFAASKAAFQSMYRRYRLMRALQVLRLDRAWSINLILMFFVAIQMFLCCCGCEGVRGKMVQTKTSDFAFTKHMSTANNRRVIKTRAGLIGLVPGLAKKGDLITLCSGGKLAILLRAQGEGFRMVGDCYVHGLMDGRVWCMLEGSAERSGEMWDVIKQDIQRREFWVS